MKVLFVSSGNSNEGISPVIRSQGESLNSAGVVLDYYSVKGKGLTNYLKGIIKLRKHLLTNNYEIIHAHYGFSAMVASLARKEEKLIASFMGDDILGSRNSEGKVTLFSRLISWININLGKNFYCAIIVKSAEMQRCFGKKSGKTFIIPNGVNLSVFKPIDKEFAYSMTGWEKNHKHVIFVSDPTRTEKNFALARTSVERLNDLTIEFHVLKKTPNNQLVYYYNAADCLLLSSLHEGSPNVIKEAMACNCPVVSTRVGDVEWVFGETEGCYLTESDPVNFSEKLKAAIRYSEEMGRTNGRERIISLGLNSESVANRIIELYHKVLLD